MSTTLVTFGISGEGFLPPRRVASGDDLHAEDKVVPAYSAGAARLMGTLQETMGPDKTRSLFERQPYYGEYD